MLPAEETRIVIEPEIRAAQAWAERHGISFTWLPESLEARVNLAQPKTGATFHLRGRFPDYRAFAPEWLFTDSTWSMSDRLVDAPEPVQTPYGASIFLSYKGRAIICAPFNRLAYACEGGPHGDWKGPSEWMDAGRNKAGQEQKIVRGDTVGDMLQAIYRDFSFTEGRMG